MNEKDIRIDYFRGSGPGGQHRNTSETGVRITHLPSGVVATATESRSRNMNLQRAMAREDCLGRAMSGSGTSYFGICRHAKHTQRVARRLQANGVGSVFAVRSCR